MMKHHSATIRFYRSLVKQGSVGIVQQQRLLASTGTNASDDTFGNHQHQENNNTGVTSRPNYVSEQPVSYSLASNREYVLREVNLMIDKGELHQAEEFLCAQDLSSIQQSIRLFNRILVAYVDAGMVSDTERLLRLLSCEHHLPSPDVYSYNLLLKAVPSPYQAGKMLRHMLSQGIEADASSFNTVIHAFSKEGKLNEAVQVLELCMKHCNDELNVVTFSPILQGFARRGEALQAEQLLTGMRRRGVEPDIVAYTSVIYAWSRFTNDLKRGPHEALRVLRQMEKESLQPDVAVYNAVLNSFAKAGNMADAAYELLNTMDVSPNVVTYATVLLAYKTTPSASVKEAYELLVDMKERGLQPNVVVLSTLISLYARHGHAEEAESILHSMEEPNIVTYGAVVEAWSNSNEPDALERALAVVATMRFTRPNVIIYNTLLKVAERCTGETNKVQAIERIRDLIERSHCGEVVPNIRTYNGMLATCAALTDGEGSSPQANHDAVQYALSCLVEVKRSLQVDDYTYPSLFKVLANRQAPFHVIRQVFTTCCQDQSVDKMVLSHLKRCCSLQELKGMLQLKYVNTVDDIRLQQLPSKWKRRIERSHKRDRK